MREFKTLSPKEYGKTGTKISLSNTFKYRTKFNLSGVQVSMSCGYNVINKHRWIILTSSFGETLLSQTFLKIGKRCELTPKAQQENLDYYVTLVKKDKAKVIPDNYDYINWATDFDLYFYGRDYSITEQLENNLVSFLVKG